MGPASSRTRRVPFSPEMPTSRRNRGSGLARTRRGCLSADPCAPAAGNPCGSGSKPAATHSARRGSPGRPQSATCGRPGAIPPGLAPGPVAEAQRNRRARCRIGTTGVLRHHDRSKLRPSKQATWFARKHRHASGIERASTARSPLCRADATIPSPVDRRVDRCPRSASAPRGEDVSRIRRAGASAAPVSPLPTRGSTASTRCGA